MTDHRIDADRIGEVAAKYRSKLDYHQRDVVQSFDIFVYRNASRIINNPRGDQSPVGLNWAHQSEAKTTADTLRADLQRARVFKKIPLSALIYFTAGDIIAYQQENIRDPRRREYPHVILQSVAFDVVGVIFPNNGLRRDIPNW
ncbi:hypothetical protein HY029_00975 [Candidatus Gottesmanbacteria bacterium]|nr:hypothetical protein [Candidatus Gottesmanbacteria bacterium]